MNWTTFLVSVAASCLMLGCSKAPQETILEVYHAGSLSVPFEKVELAFEAGHPGVDVRRQAHGSAMAIRQVTELGKPADVVASADYGLIDRMMIEARPQWATYNILFARNSICITLRPGLEGVTSDNCLAELLRDGRRVAMSNPNQDPCGYRTLMTLYLAETALGSKGVFDDLILKNSNITIDRSSAPVRISVPAAAEFTGNLVVRPKETDLIPLLQTGSADFLLIYKSVAVQHSLAFVQLPDEVNLGDPKYLKLYSTVSVRLNADAAEPVDVSGDAIVYGVTIPTAAPHPQLAREFVKFLLSDDGRRIFRECGQEPLDPPVSSDAGEKVDFAN